MYPLCQSPQREEVSDGYILACDSMDGNTTMLTLQVEASLSYVESMIVSQSSW